jgi:hypothetical protein
MKYLLLILIFIIGCESSKLTLDDLTIAKCICSKYKANLVLLERRNTSIFFSCDNGAQFQHSDDSYTEGCRVLK